MDSKEFGLVAAQQLFQIDDLHYGIWGNGISTTIENFKQAQDAYTEFLFKHIRESVPDGRVLDVGCGTGSTTRKLLALGYKADGLVPSPWMARHARTKVENFKSCDQGSIYECKFEDFTLPCATKKYDLVFFSESFQYIRLDKAFKVLDQILTDNGRVIIFDFFKKERVEGKSPLGGGHSIGKFYNGVKNNNYFIHLDLDITSRFSPNLRLVNEILIDRIIPFCQALDSFLSGRYRFIYFLAKKLINKKIEKWKYKYSKDRNAENFEKFKTYRLIVLKKIVPGGITTP